MWDWSRPSFIVAFMGDIGSTVVAGPQVFTLALEEARAKEAKEEDGQLPALPRDDPLRRELPLDGRRWGRGGQRARAHDEEVHGTD